MYKMLKIKYSQATVWEVFKKRPADEVYVCHYELTVMTLKGETFAGFKIQR